VASDAACEDSHDGVPVSVHDVRLEITINADGDGVLEAIPFHPVDSENPEVRVVLAGLIRPFNWEPKADPRRMTRALLEQLADAIREVNY
jgi:hypothetical protein